MHGPVIRDHGPAPNGIVPLDPGPRHNVLLYSTLLYSTLLYSTIVYSTILYYTILYYTILYYTILYYTIQVQRPFHHHILATPSTMAWSGDHQPWTIYTYSYIGILYDMYICNMVYKHDIYIYEVWLYIDHSMPMRSST